MRVGSYGGSEQVSGEQYWDRDGNKVDSRSQSGSTNSVEQYGGRSGTAPAAQTGAVDPLSILSAGLMGFFAQQGAAGASGNPAQSEQVNLLLSFIGNIAAQLLAQQDMAATVTEFARGKEPQRQNGTHSYAGPRASSNGQVGVGPDGVRAGGSFEAGVGAGVEGYGSTSGAAGTAEGCYQAGVDAKVCGQGEAYIGPTGAQFSGDLYVGTEASASAGGRLESAPIVNVGGYPVTAHAGGNAEARAGAYAEASADATVSYSPPEAAVTAEVGAFAGARAGVSAETGIGPASVSGTAEAWAGIGATANMDAGYRDGKLTIDFGYGFAFGLGAGYSGTADIDVDGIAQAAAGILGPAFGEALKGAIIAGVMGLASGAGAQAPQAQTGGRPAAQTSGGGSAPVQVAQQPVSTTPVNQAAQNDDDNANDDERDV